MKRPERSLARLRRQHRAAQVERRSQLAQLAELRSEQQRFSALASRSASLSLAYGVDAAASAAALADRMRFSAALSTLGRTATRDASRIERAADEHEQRAARQQKRCETIDSKMAEALRNTARAGLARSLQRNADHHDASRRARKERR